MSWFTTIRTATHGCRAGTRRGRAVTTTSRPNVEGLEDRYLLSGAGSGRQPGAMVHAEAINYAATPAIVNGTVIQTASGNKQFTHYGPNVLARRSLSLSIATDANANGLNGSIQTEETILRLGATHDFVGNYTQYFTGSVRINGVSYTGKLTQQVQVYGHLNPNLPLTDPSQGAMELTGTFKIVGGSGQLKRLTGFGTLQWPGGDVAPTYQGVFRFA